MCLFLSLCRCLSALTAAVLHLYKQEHVDPIVLTGTYDQTFELPLPLGYSEADRQYCRFFWLCYSNPERPDGHTMMPKAGNTRVAEMNFDNGFFRGGAWMVIGLKPTKIQLPCKI